MMMKSWFAAKEEDDMVILYILLFPLGLRWLRKSRLDGSALFSP